MTELSDRLARATVARAGGATVQYVLHRQVDVHAPSPPCNLDSVAEGRDGTVRLGNAMGFKSASRSLRLEDACGKG